MNKSKLLLLLSIVTGSLILGGFFYALQVNKQEFIKNQLGLELQAKKLESETKQKSLENQIKCKEDAEVYFIELKNESFLPKYSPTYNFNHKLNTCLLSYVTGVSETKFQKTRSYETIFDVYSNQTVAEHEESQQQDGTWEGSPETYEEWRLKHDELMGQE